MRFIGNKENLLSTLDGVMRRHGVVGERFFDLFAGTTNVGRYFKTSGCVIESCDMLYFSYCLQKAYIENNDEPQFTGLLPELPATAPGALLDTPLERVVEYLNGIDDAYGFVSQHYTPLGTGNLEKPRMYFSEENGLRIDAIRQRIELWHELALLTEPEYYVLLSCLIESVSFYANVSGVYAAFQKKWDPRAVKRFRLRPIAICGNGRDNHVHHGDSLTLVPTIDTDILYLDPPYNERQYLPNYHVVETIARYDNPPVRGVTGMRPYDSEKSTFCNASTALRDLDFVAANANYRYLALSYNSEGIMPAAAIIDTLGRYGEVRVESMEYARFKSNNNGLSGTKRHVNELLFILKR